MFCIPLSSLSQQQLVQLAAEKLNGHPEEWEKNIWQLISNWYTPAVTQIKVFTSGSTGTPKEILHSKQAMANSALITCHALQLKHGDEALLCLPATKIAGIMMVIRSICTGMNLHCIKPSATPLESLPVMHFNFAAFTPMQLHSAAKNYNHFKKGEAIDKIILGGENIGAEVLQTVNQMQNEVYLTFGMTETISHIALKKINGKNADAHFKVLEGISILTNDKNQLVIDAPLLEQHHLVTNDIVRIVNEKEFDWLGRTDNVINSGGVKINPEELEQQLQHIIQPAFFIASLPDGKTGEKLVLAIEMQTLSAQDKKELHEAFQKFDKLHRPKSVLLFSRFVRTENGKTKRRETLKTAFEVVDANELSA